MKYTHFAAGLALWLGAAGTVPAQTVDEPVVHPAIPLLDEQGNHVLVSGRPYSPRTSCGTAGCHDYDGITHAFHIEQGRDEADDGYGARHGLSQLVGPGYFGGYNCMGGNNPDQLARKVNASADLFADYGAAGIVQRCSSCHSGGGWMEKDRKGRRYDRTDPATVAPFDGDYYNRGTGPDNAPASVDTVAQWDWRKSGVVENDCLMCHLDLGALQVTDPKLQVKGGPDAGTLFGTLRDTKLIKGGHFRYADTAILEHLDLGLPGGAQQGKHLVTFAKANVKAADDGHGGSTLSYDLETDAAGNPVLAWNPAAFDSRGKVTLPMLRFPANDNCMQCHLTSNSRRGFYGFGEGAAATYEADGTLVEDYQDDVHYGTRFTEANGETRDLVTCNACHARNYFRSAYLNTDLDADHNFLKGNSDMDVHNDRDFRPGAKSCLYCHETAVNAAIPSGHPDMLTAHQARWKSAGDLRGYPESALAKVTQTHLDVVSCQACHITGKQYAGKPIQIQYRYRREEDGQLRMVPYSARARYFWKDKVSGRVLTKTERNSVYRLVTGPDGKKRGEVFDPQTQTAVLTVGARMSHGTWVFDDPADYAGVKALKGVYDKLLAGKGVKGADTALVWTEVNNYLMSHNTRPAVSAVACDDCHNRKSNGSVSSFVSDDGILGSGNIKTVTQIADPRLVAEGVVILDLPYLRMDGAGKVTENVSDILYYTLVNPSMTRLNAETVPEMRGGPRLLAKEAALTEAGLNDAGARAAASGALYDDEAYLFRPHYGAAPLRGLAVMAGAGFQSRLLLPYASFRASLAPDKSASAASAAPGARLATDLFRLEAINAEGDSLTSLLGTELLVVLPYRGAQAGTAGLRVLRSDDGNAWEDLGAGSVLAVVPAAGEEPGYLVLRTTRLGYLTLADPRGAVVASCATPESCGY